MQTYIDSTRGTRYILSWNTNSICEESLKRVCNYYCKSSSEYEVTFVLGHGSRFLTISVDCLLLHRNSDSFIKSILYELRDKNVTGIRAESREEALEVEQEILKGYEWHLLKN